MKERIIEMIQNRFVFLACLPYLLFFACDSGNPVDTSLDRSFKTDGVSVMAIQRNGSMVLVPSSGKSFIMGYEDGHATERPAHSVTFSYDYWIDTTEITQSRYSAIMKAAGFKYPDDNWTQNYGKGDSFPVHSVTWYDAALFCNARSIAEGYKAVYTYIWVDGDPGDSCVLNNLQIDFTADGYRLPTEAEWEYAARAGLESRFYWDTLYTGDFLWHIENSDMKSHVVATRHPNQFGLYDMYGNVWEWCNDWPATINITPNDN